MNIDLFFSISIFLIFVLWIIYYLSNLNTSGLLWEKTLQIRKMTIDFVKTINSFGEPSDWDKERIIPQKPGLLFTYYSIPLLITNNCDYERFNEPIYLFLNFDEECLNLTWNETIRIYDENFKEVPFKFVKQEFCSEGYLKNSIVFFEVNISSKSSKIYQVLFSNISSIKFKDYGNFSNLVLWLTFDEGSGTIAYDYSGNSNHGTIYNGTQVCAGNLTHNTTCPQWVDGVFGKALSFDGVDDYLEVYNSPKLNPIDDGFTISFWINLSSYVSPGAIITKRTDYLDGYFIFIWNNNNLYFDWGGSDNNRWNTNYSPQLNNWYFITFLQNSSGRFLYVNGNIISYTSNKGNTSLASSNSPLRIFSDTIDLRYFNSGIIDELRIYNRDLSEEEIISYYTCGPLDLRIYPIKNLELLSFEKMEVLRNFSYSVIKDIIQKGYNFRVEVYEK
ncbi:MAG: LamG domain-containing protein [Candidatus Aenigmatarchaeota archaeon]